MVYRKETIRFEALFKSTNLAKLPSLPESLAASVEPYGLTQPVLHSVAHFLRFTINFMLIRAAAALCFALLITKERNRQDMPFYCEYATANPLYFFYRFT